MPVNKEGKLIPTEYQECKTFWDYALYHPLMRDYLIKLTNEGKREAWYGRSLLNIGMRPGIPDYFYPLPNGRWGGLWLEMKRSDGQKARKNLQQEQWIEKLLAIKHYACYAYGAEHAMEIWKQYVNNEI